MSPELSGLTAYPSQVDTKYRHRSERRVPCGEVPSRDHNQHRGCCDQHPEFRLPQQKQNRQKRWEYCAKLERCQVSESDLCLDSRTFGASSSIMPEEDFGKRHNV